MTWTVNYIGPFVHHDVVVEGWSVPLLTAHPCGDHDERVMLVIDRRIAITVTVEEAERFVPFLADAISAALGFGAHPRGESSGPLPSAPPVRPTRMHGIVALGEDSAIRDEDARSEEAS